MIRYIGIAIIILSGCNTSNSKILNRANKISLEISHLDTISDFSSNRNRPAKDVQNIGPRLYEKIRLFQKKGITSTSTKEIKTQKYDTDRYGDGLTFEVRFKSTNNESMRFFLLYSFDEDFFRITGY